MALFLRLTGQRPNMSGSFNRSGETHETVDADRGTGVPAAAPPQQNNGVIQGRVTRVGTSEGISDVQITLVGTSP